MAVEGVEGKGEKGEKRKQVGTITKAWWGHFHKASRRLPEESEASNNQGRTDYPAGQVKKGEVYLIS